MAKYPERIVCLTAETTETLYLLGEQDRIVGISGFTVRPPQARKEKQKVSAFTRARIERILGLKPDLVLGFSDLQSEIAGDLIKRGMTVLVFNQRSIQEILTMVLMLGSLVGVPERGKNLVGQLESHLEHIRQQAGSFPIKPVIYFEEWNDPLITGIRWVSELIEIAGGRDCFSELSGMAGAKDRIIKDPTEVVRRRPDIIVGSWCGKKFRPEGVRQRPGWDELPAVKEGQLFEIKSPNILQPGPAALTDGVDQLHQIVSLWQKRKENVVDSE